MKLRDRQSFELAMRPLVSIGNLDCRLPCRVFCPGVIRAYCFEFDLFSGAAFWRLVQSLGRLHGDSTVVVSAIDPDPDEYFFKEFGEFGATSLSVNIDADQYFEELAACPIGWPVDSLLDNSEVLVWFGESGEWLIWGERSVGVALLGTRKTMDIAGMAATAGLSVFSATEAVSELVAPNFKNDSVPEDWQLEFLRNYSSSDS